jgi:hypothetical protein
MTLDFSPIINEIAFHLEAIETKYNVTITVEGVQIAKNQAENENESETEPEPEPGENEGGK